MAEKDAILNNPELVSAFEEIDKAITKNTDLKSFRQYLIANPKILPHLNNIPKLKSDLWVAYLKNHTEGYTKLDAEYALATENLERIISQARDESTDWLEVIRIFNERFNVPFKLKVGNQEDVILKSDGPIVEFKFHDVDEMRDIKESQLIEVLSNGEKRAMYILNIIFEVEARKKESQETLFIIDDIADSFDYKNKYAIIEYLKDIESNELFNQVVLSHNYDFFRTISSRLDMDRPQKMTTVKTDTGIELKEELYQKNPFNHWRAHMAVNSRMLIASIPFVRNLAEYTGDSKNFSALTSLLHIRANTATITLTELGVIFSEILKNYNSANLEGDKTVLDIIYETADSIVEDDEEVAELETKICLAIAIRLRAEEYMIDRINDSVFMQSIKRVQTRKLTDKYEELFPESRAIELLHQVSLMTPENIHLNSFMYEPILDMANGHLKTLYLDLAYLNIDVL
jgi:hypothetical protein